MLGQEQAAAAGVICKHSGHIQCAVSLMHSLSLIDVGKHITEFSTAEAYKKTKETYCRVALHCCHILAYVLKYDYVAVQLLLSATWLNNMQSEAGV